MKIIKYHYRIDVILKSLATTFTSTYNKNWSLEAYFLDDLMKLQYAKVKVKVK